MKNKKLILFGMILLVSNFFVYQPKINADFAPFIFLVAKTYENSYGIDYFNLIEQHLLRIGIGLEIVIESWPEYVADLMVYHNFDLCYLSSMPGGNGPDFSHFFSENGSINILGYDTSWDWNESLGTGLNEWYLQEGKKIFPPNSQERIEHYWAWEQYLMSNLCLLYPLFSPKYFAAYYANLQGYQMTKNIYQNWGAISWEGTHQGQKDTTALVLYGGAATPNLDYFNFYDYEINRNAFFGAFLDPIIWIDKDQTIWPHLAKSFTFINNSTIEIKTRDNIKWAADPDGNFTNEYFDARDIYFTLYYWKYLSLDKSSWEWLTDIQLIDSKTIRLSIDGDPHTPEKELCQSCMEKLNTFVLPEHYLNQSQLGDGKTPDMNHLAWEHYQRQPFGTGLFSLTDFQENAEIELTIRSDCWWLNTSVTSDEKLNWEQRFGTFHNPIEKLRLLFYSNNYFALEQFEKGRIDFIDITNFPEKITEYRDNPTFTVGSELKNQFSFIGFNILKYWGYFSDDMISSIDPTITKGTALRKALFYAIDKTELNAIVHGNTLESVYWPIPKAMGVWCNPDIIRYEKPQLTKARDFMYIAGFGVYCPIPTPIIGQGIGLYAMCVFWVSGAIVIVSKKRSKTL
ncbi:MAG: ABC transporter substrate-binding protein [Candidatus Heimdallarchaeota archaeon]|nr:ABC transporter substrate-binding protein [Candidatus Heimdallarchaeota archaeon]